MATYQETLSMACAPMWLRLALRLAVAGAVLVTSRSNADAVPCGIALPK